MPECQKFAKAPTAILISAPASLYLVAFLEMLQWDDFGPISAVFQKLLWKVCCLLTHPRRKSSISWTRGLRTERKTSKGSLNHCLTENQVILGGNEDVQVHLSCQSSLGCSVCCWALHGTDGSQWHWQWCRDIFAVFVTPWSPCLCEMTDDLGFFLLLCALSPGAASCEHGWPRPAAHPALCHPAQSCLHSASNAAVIFACW